MDLAAQAAGADPVDYRLRYLGGDGADQMRMAGVLKLAAEKANWGNTPTGHSKGIAVHKSFGSYVAEVVEISGSPNDGLRIENITCAVDCGIAVSPILLPLKWKVELAMGSGMLCATKLP